jgi:hypothetical protein
MGKLVSLLGVSAVGVGLLAHTTNAAGTVIVGAERLTGVGAESVTQTQEEGGVESEQTVDTTTIALLGSGRGSLLPLGGSLFPRIGVDGVLGPGVTLGGSLMYTRTSGEVENSVTVAGETDTSKDDQPTISWLLLHPRVGYMAPLSPTFWIWPRGGITYSVTSLESENEAFINGVVTNQTRETTLTFTQATLELLFLASPLEGGAITSGAYADLPLGGESATEIDPRDPVDPEPEALDMSLVSYGLVAGVALMF